MGHSLEKASSTQLKGMMTTLTEGLISGDLEVDMTIVDLINLIDKAIKVKLKPFKKKMSGVKEEGKEDEIWT